MVFWLGFFAYNHTFWLLSDNKQYQEVISKRIYPLHRLSPELINQLKQKIETIMQSDQLYRDPDLNWERLAQAVAIDTKTLKYIFKHEFRQSFWAWITAYRLQEAKKRLANPKYSRFEPSTIGLEVGFSSRKQFKKVMDKSKQVSRQS